MAVYGTRQSGGIRQVGPGEFLTLFDGTEEGAAVSIPFARGYSGGQSEYIRTFWATGVGSETLTVEGSNTDVDADYGTIGNFVNVDSPAGSNYFFSDDGASAFYRVRKTGGTPVVKVQA